MTQPFTHLGYRPRIGRLRVGRRGRTSAGDDNAGVVHALNRSAPWNAFLSLCGVAVSLDDGQVEPNVWPAGEDGEVTCKRCLDLL